ncbi:MAG: alanine racemase [Candidatus Bathyarchaeia archaeon]
MLISDLDTPAVTAELPILEKNIRDMAAHCKELDIPLRAHIKTHKIPEIAHMQIASGAIGICCQKLGEAEVMVAAGIKNVLIPYNIVGRQKVERLLRLVKRATITVALDSEATAIGIAEQAKEEGLEVPVIIELDTGGHRCGVQSPEEARHLARKIVKLPGLSFQGIMTHPSLPEAEPFIRHTVEMLKADGISVNIISGGGTGLEAISKAIGCTETRSGSYAFEGMKRINRTTNPPNPVTCVLRVICTVVSTPTPNRIIIDGGMKTFASYPPTPYGYIVEDPNAKIYAMSVEHGHVDISTCSTKFKVGDRISVIPLHQEMCLNLHDKLYGVRNGKVEVVWDVAARGKVQ